MDGILWLGRGEVEGAQASYLGGREGFLDDDGFMTCMIHCVAMVMIMIMMTS